MAIQRWGLAGLLGVMMLFVALNTDGLLGQRGMEILRPRYETASFSDRVALNVSEAKAVGVSGNVPEELRPLVNRPDQPATEESRESGLEQARPPPIEKTLQTYPAECAWAFDESGTGYPPVAPGPTNLVCPSMFRDLSDLVYSWPYAHFQESVFVMDKHTAAANLPPVPIIYSHVDQLRRGELVPWLRRLQRPYILVTGQSDWGVPSTEHSREVLEDGNLVMWFAQNNDEPHPKITPVPIGLNCFEHGPEMQRVLQDQQQQQQQQQQSAPTQKELLLVNFGKTHPAREQIWSALCEGPEAFAVCKIKGTVNNIRGNPHLVDFYKEISTFKYVACPRGNGLDTHRVWEALYLGAVPVLERSPLDPLYSDLPVLLVDSLKGLTRSQLEEAWPQFEGAVGRPLAKLTREHWLRMIEGVRRAAMHQRGLQDVQPRKRCWGAARRRRRRLSIL